MAQDFPPFSQEAPQNSDLSRTAREQRYGKDYGERTAPILQFLDECNTVSDVAALVAATEPPLGAICIVFVWFHQPSSPPIVWERGGGTNRWECA